MIDALDQIFTPAAVVEDLGHLGARLRVRPPVGNDDAERWSFTAPTNLPACRRLLLMTATFSGRGWLSTKDMSPGAKIRFADRRFNAAFCDAIRRRARR